jgi:3-mercaptopyruvate sulfurtransferase SseA
MGTQTEWENEVKGMLKAEIKRRNMTYEQLAERLAEIGVEDSARNIINKINRGSFSAVFFVQCLRAIGVQDIRI